MALVSEQVKILLERMDLCPDEFVRAQHLGIGGSTSKWEYVLQSGEFNYAEKFLIKRKIKQLRRKATQEMIMQTIMDDSSPQDFSFDTVSRAAKTLLNTPRMRMKQP